MFGRFPAVARMSGRSRERLLEVDRTNRETVALAPISEWLRLLLNYPTSPRESAAPQRCARVGHMSEENGFSYRSR